MNKFYTNLFRWIIILFTVATIQIFPQNEKYEIEAEVISLEELMNILVVTASKEEQSISDAPAIIDVITELQIKDFNATNLYELLSFLPGVEMMETFWGRTTLNFRGITNIHYTNKVLVMINGSPLFEPILGSYYLEQLPVNSISRIEVIRGPGSSLYGTNAYSGVINVITKDGIGDSKVSVGLSYGSYNTVTGELSAKIKLNEKSGFFVSSSYTGTEGYPFDIKADEKGRALELDYKNTPFNLFANLKYDKLSVDFSYMQMKKTHYGLTPNIDYTGEHEFNNIFVSGKYSLDLADNLQAMVVLRLNSFENPGSTTGYFPVKGYGGHPESIVKHEFQGSSFGAELQFNYTISDQVTNVSGISYESLSSDPYNFLWANDNTIHPMTAYKNSQTSNNIAGYTQFTYKPVQALSFVGGLRFVKDKDVEDAFLLPRAGVIYKISDSYFLKLLYGKAFRAPTFFEKYVATYNVLYGNDKLNPETIQTVDLGLELIFGDGFKARINGYFEGTSDGIERTKTSSPATQGANAAVYANASKYDYYGVEVSVNGLVGETGYYGFNLGLKDGKNSDTDADLFGFSPFTANGWLNLRFANFRVTPFFQFVGERKGVSARKVNNVAVGNYSLDSYFLMNLTLGYKLDQFMIQAGVKNLFNTDYSYPEFIRGLSEEVPGGPGINYTFSVKYQY